jgi:hypothetical protein
MSSLQPYARPVNHFQGIQQGDYVASPDGIPNKSLIREGWRCETE